MAIKGMTESLGREPSQIELARKMKTTTKKLRQYEQYSMGTTTLIPETDERKFEDLGLEDESSPSPSDLLFSKDLKKFLMKEVERLDPREKDIIMRRFGFGSNNIETLEHIGKRYKISRERIRQVENIAIVKIRDAFRKKNIGMDC